MTVGEVDLSPLSSSAPRQRRDRGGVGGGRVRVGREGGTGLIGVGERVEREGGVETCLRAKGKVLVIPVTLPRH